jgi:hypothetical protein
LASNRIANSVGWGIVSNALPIQLASSVADIKHLAIRADYPIDTTP